METICTTASRATPWPPATERAARIGRVKFMALPLEAAETLGPVPRRDPAVADPRTGARFLAFLARIAFRVSSRPPAARP